MHTVLLCPGPSLRTGYAPARAADLVIGVNRAPLIAANDGGPRVDWWVADYRRFLDVELPYRPRVVMRADGMRLCYQRGHGDKVERHEIVTQEDLMQRWPAQPIEWTRKSACTALVLAADLGATRIDCYGCDWTCEPDVDGVSHKSDKRTPERWESEAEVWHALVELLGKSGITVDRKAASR